MSTQRSGTEVQIDALTRQTDRLAMVVEKVAEGMATLLATTAANDVKHDAADEFKKETKQVIREFRIELKEVRAILDTLKGPIIKNSLVSNAVTGVAMLLIGIVARSLWG